MLKLLMVCMKYMDFCEGGYWYFVMVMFDG